MVAKGSPKRTNKGLSWNFCMLWFLLALALTFTLLSPCTFSSIRDLSRSINHGKVFTHETFTGEFLTAGIGQWAAILEVRSPSWTANSMITDGCLSMYPVLHARSLNFFFFVIVHLAYPGNVPNGNFFFFYFAMRCSFHVKVYLICILLVDIAAAPSHLKQSLCQFKLMYWISLNTSFNFSSVSVEVAKQI